MRLMMSPGSPWVGSRRSPPPGLMNHWRRTPTLPGDAENFQGPQTADLESMEFVGLSVARGARSMMPDLLASRTSWRSSCVQRSASIWLSRVYRDRCAAPTPG